MRITMIPSNDKSQDTVEPRSNPGVAVDMAKINGEPKASTTGEKPAAAPDVPKPPSKLQKLWKTIGLDLMTVQLMVKGSIPPTIAIAAFQSDAFAAHFSTLGGYQGVENCP